MSESSERGNHSINSPKSGTKLRDKAVSERERDKKKIIADVRVYILIKDNRDNNDNRPRRNVRRIQRRFEVFFFRAILTQAKRVLNMFTLLKRF